MIDKELSDLKNDIPNINIEDFKCGVYKKYDKKNKKSIVLKYRPAFKYGIVAILVILITVLILKDIRGGVGIEKYPSVINPQYEDFIKDSFENSIGKDPTLDESGPIPAPPIIDGYFNIEKYSNNPGNGDPADKPGNEIQTPVKLDIPSFEYIYEVVYQDYDSEVQYVTVYLEKTLAKKIYKECKNIMDAPNADPIEIVNGSIVDWFYSNEYYNEDKVFWCGYENSSQIYSKIGRYVCVGVYHPQKREIVREIFSNKDVNIVEDVYTKLYFKNEGNLFLTPIIDIVENKAEWYASNNQINKTNTFFLFDYCYGSKMDCVVDKEANTIKLKTYAVQNEDELQKNYSQLLKDYHIWSNSVIVNNERPNNKLGENTYITYKYKELVEILQFLSKYK